MRSILEAYWDSKLPIYDIRLSQLQKEGINCLLIDVDGTLINRKSSRIPKAVKDWISESKKFFSLYLISNNPSEKRISKIAKDLDIRYKFNALKPRKKATAREPPVRQPTFNPYIIMTWSLELALPVPVKHIWA